MATVMLSGKLVDGIIWNIQRPLDEKAAKLDGKAHKIVGEIARDVWNDATQGDQAKLYAANHDYIRWSDHVWITVITPWNEKFSGHHNVGVSVPVTMLMCTPPGLTVSDKHPRYVEICDLIQERNTLRKEAKEVGPKFKELCSRCGSLADVVKIFPSVLNYLDAETKARLDRKVERKKNKPTELPEDLASSLVKSRIFNSSGA